MMAMFRRWLVGGHNVKPNSTVIEHPDDSQLRAHIRHEQEELREVIVRLERLHAETHVLTRKHDERSPSGVP